MIFPIHPGSSAEAKALRIPWAMIAKHERQAISNHGQTLKRLAQRSGCCPTEILSILTDTKLWPITPEPRAIKRIATLIEEWNVQEGT